MKAIVLAGYGSPDVLRLEELGMPEVGEEQILVRVRAASVNALDWHRMRGMPILVRATDGLRRPKDPRLGADAAGVVEAIGSAVADLSVGDEVYGVRTGAFGEYVAGKNFVPKPANLTFEEAAAIPVAGCTALQGVRDRGGLKSGERVLVNGAGGGVGSFAVQIAKALGGHVTAVSSTAHLDMLRSIGADAVIDYTVEDVTQRPDRYDLVVDLAGTRSLGAMRRTLNPGGRLVILGAIGSGAFRPMDRMIGAMLTARFISKSVISFIAEVTKPDLLFLKELAEAGKLRPAIERTYPLAETAAAIRHIETGRTRGKVVITI